MLESIQIQKLMKKNSFMFLRIIQKESMKELNFMEKDMGLVLFITVKEESTLDNGLKTKCMDKVHYITLTIKSLIKEIGKKISYQDMEHYLMKKFIF